MPRVSQGPTPGEVSPQDAEQPGGGFARSDPGKDFLAPKWPDSEWLDLDVAARIVEHGRSFFDGMIQLAGWAHDGVLRTRSASAIYRVGVHRRQETFQRISPEYWSADLLGDWTADHWLSGEAQFGTDDGVTFYGIKMRADDLRDCLAGGRILRDDSSRTATSAVEWINRQVGRGYNQKTGWQAYHREFPRGLKKESFEADWNAVHQRSRGHPAAKLNPR